MITKFLIDIVYFFVFGIVQVVSSFGTVTANNALTSSIVAFKSYYVSLAAIIPLGTILAIIAFELAFEAGFFVYKLVRWGYQKVPGIN